MNSLIRKHPRISFPFRAIRYTSSSSDLVPVVFMRHGQSTWNKQNIFIGMADPPLTDEGITEARNAAKILSAEGLQFDYVFTSLLRRATKTACVVVEELGLDWVPMSKDWQLNERNYGSLVGLCKKKCIEKFGKEQVKKWRRSWDERPPLMTHEHPYWPGHDRRYKSLGIRIDEIPSAESLADVTARTSKYWDDVVTPLIKSRKRVLIVGHENNLRSILKRVDNISNEDIIDLDIPRAVPLLYNFDPATMTTVPVEGAAPLLSGRYLTNGSDSYVERNPLFM